MQKRFLSRFRKLKNLKYNKNLFKKKEKEKKSNDIKSRRYIIKLNEFEKNHRVI